MSDKKTKETMTKIGKTVVVEHTLYKAKRRITYIDQIRAMFPEVIIEVYIMKPSDSRWKTYIKERNLSEAEIVKEVLANEDMWQEDLNQFANMHEVVTSYLKLINEKGMKEALISFLNI